MPNLNTEQRHTLVEQLCERMRTQYVFPEKAEEAAQHLNSKVSAGEYNSIIDADAFASQLTTDLQAVTRDLHLQVNYNPKAYDSIKAQQANPDDKQQQIEREALLRYENYGFEKVERMAGNIGYIKLKMFADAATAGHVAIGALQFVSGCDAVIFDLRENGGGTPTMIQLICSYLFKEPKHLNTFYWRPDDRYNQFWSYARVEGKKLVDTLVYVLTSKLTFSAAEEFTYDLKNLERATIIGETTGGGAHPGGAETLTEGFVAWISKGRAINPITETNWEGTGVEPHIQVNAEDALKTAHLQAIEDLINTADDDKKRATLNWELATIRATYDPPQPDLDIAAACAGTYGDLLIRDADGHLIITDRIGSRPLVALSPTLYMDSFIDTRRFEFVLADGAAAAESLRILNRVNPHVMVIPRGG